MLVNCLPPVIDENCTALILGSMPSVISREKEFYYANPSNRFWKLLSEILGENFTDMSVKEKKSALLRRHIALYDVFSSCEIEGSLDSDIRRPLFNDIPSLIAKTNIKSIFITSKYAYNSFIKKFGDLLSNVKIVNLPSPSGANRSKFRTDGELLSEWKRLFVF